MIQDVVYNHFTPDGERAESALTRPIRRGTSTTGTRGRRATTRPSSRRLRQINETTAGTSTTTRPAGSRASGKSPVRQLFISSAAALMIEFHVDGFRVDQTSSLHSYASLHADGRPATAARIFGAKFLREWTTTMRLLKPAAFLIAEDHSGGARSRRPPTRVVSGSMPRGTRTSITTWWATPVGARNAPTFSAWWALEMTDRWPSIPLPGS